MLDVDRLKEKLGSISDEEASKDRGKLILREVLYEFNQVEPSLIDTKKSDFTEENSGEFLLKLYSINDSRCPVFIELIETNIIDIQVGSGGEYLYYQKINTDQDIHKLQSTLHDLFHQPIKETRHYCNDNIYKRIYAVPYEDSNGSEQVYKFSVHTGGCAFWKKKSKEEVFYEPWIN